VLAQFSGRGVDHEWAELDLRNRNWRCRLRHIDFAEFALGGKAFRTGQKSTTKAEINQK